MSEHERKFNAVEDRAAIGKLVRPVGLSSEVRRFDSLSAAEKIRVGERWKRELLTLRRMK